MPLHHTALNRERHIARVDGPAVGVGFDRLRLRRNTRPAESASDQTLMRTYWLRSPRRSTRTLLMPPNPNEFDIAMRMAAGRPCNGT